MPLTREHGNYISQPSNPVFLPPTSVDGTLSILGSVNIASTSTSNFPFLINSSTGNLVTRINNNGFISAGDGVSLLAVNEASNLQRPLNIAGSTATLRVWRTSTGDPAYEMISGTDFVNGPAATGNTWWDFYTNLDNFYIRRRTGGVGENYLNILSTGNTGIGLNIVPRVRLQVSASNQTALPTLGTPSGSLLLTNNDALYGVMSGVLATGNAWIQVQRVDNVATAYDLVLQPSGGNLGVGGVPAAAYIVDIQRTGSGTSTGMRVYNSATAASSGARIDLQQGAVNTFVDSVSNTTGRLGTSTNHPLDIITNNTTRMTIAAAGGISTPNSITVASSSNILLATDSGGSISMGRVDNVASSPYIDFNSGATTVDYDVRIQASGGTGTSGQGTLTISGNLIQNVNTTAKTGAYTLNRVDANTLVQMNGAFAFTVPLNSTTPFPTGTIITLLALTTGVSVTFTGGITSYATPGTKLRAAGSMATLIKLNTDTWVLTGDLIA